MKTAKEYSKEWSNNPEIPFEDIIKKVQKEAYNQAIDDAVKNATLSLFDWEDGGFKEYKRRDNKFIINDGNYILIDKQSILKLKK